MPRKTKNRGVITRGFSFDNNKDAIYLRSLYDRKRFDLKKAVAAAKRIQDKFYGTTKNRKQLKNFISEILDRQAIAKQKEKNVAKTYRTNRKGVITINFEHSVSRSVLQDTILNYPFDKFDPKNKSFVKVTFVNSYKRKGKIKATGLTYAYTITPNQKGRLNEAVTDMFNRIVQRKADGSNHKIRTSLNTVRYIKLDFN